MPSDSNDRKAAARAQAAVSTAAAAPPPQSENLPCPRCDSTNTKFCYYNNYNLSQPRHFCKSCRRYWTQGGTLRNVPIGGGTRKNAKRSRTLPSANSSSGATAAVNVASSNMKMHESVCAANGGFTSLLSSQGHQQQQQQHQQQQQGFLALSGYGYGFEEMGSCGFGKGVWAYPEVSGVSDSGYGGGAVAVSAWQQMNGVEGGLVDGDSFAWPELAISTTANGLK